MWVIGLKCDGCDELLTACDVLPGDSVRFVREIVEAHADSMRWERVVSPDDGKAWYCPTCRAARDGRVLAAGVAMAEKGWAP